MFWSDISKSQKNTVFCAYVVLKCTCLFNADVQRNSGWNHLECCDVISVPDKWEFPWVGSQQSAHFLLVLCCSLCRLLICSCINRAAQGDELLGFNDW